MAQGDLVEPTADEVVVRDPGRCATGEDQQPVLLRIEGDARGRHGVALELEIAHPLAQAGEHNHRWLMRVKKKYVPGGRADRQIGAAIRRKRVHLEFPFDGAGRSIDDPDLVARREPEKEMIREGIVGQTRQFVVLGGKRRNIGSAVGPDILHGFDLRAGGKVNVQQAGSGAARGGEKQAEGGSTRDEEKEGIASANK